MRVHYWGEVGYEKARTMMQDVHTLAKKEQQNHLILCSHPNVFTVGSSEQSDFDVAVVQSDRGGSITAHSCGQAVFYFCFLVDNPARFYKKVLDAFENFFMQNLPAILYDKKNPGFYIQNRKIASLGFRYKEGVSLHGVALNVAVDLAFHSQINPCNLEGVVPTSLHNEGIMLTQEEVQKQLVSFIARSFDEAI